MRKNQKYSKEQIYLAIEKWQASGLSQYQFCKQEDISKSTFGYWYKKYKQEQSISGFSPKKPDKTFLPLEFSTHSPESSENPPERITITYPNGVQVSCPLILDSHRLTNLAKLS
jgi:transposase-like protein